MFIRSLPHLASLLLLSTLSLVRSEARNGQPDGEGVTKIDGVPIENIPTGQRATAFAQVASDRTGWIATADSFQPGSEPQHVLDGDANTIWHTAYTNAPLPHQITIDMLTPRYINALTYQPRQDGNQNGNIGEHAVYLSTDGVNWGDPVAIGTYKNDASMKTTVFAYTNARYVKLFVITEANGNPYASAAEINISNAPGPPPSPNGVGSWGPTIDLPLVSVAATVLPDRFDVLMWSSYAASAFTNGNGGQTVTASYDPNAEIVTQRIVTNTNHDMFCPGLSLDFNGRVVVTGGNDNQRTSIYDPPADNWISASNMVIGRGYQAQCTVSDGRTFVIGGSWSGGQGNKNGEIYDPNTNTWTALAGCPVGPMLTNDVEGVYRADNHGWLFAWKDGSVFQAGPSRNMNWYGTGGQGSQAGAGTRANDADSMNGNAVMYDAPAGKILTLGGAPNYQTHPDAPTVATVNAHIITLAGPNQNPQVTQINNMYFQRAFANGVVLPTGAVFVTGGQVVPAPFSDDTAQFTSELWNPNTFNFVQTAPQPIPRTYHSIALLLHDGTVFTGGGGLCGEGCATNHYDAQIYYPPYLFANDGSHAARPAISNSPGTAAVGHTIQITTAGPVASFDMIRFGSATHTVDTDQRRIPLNPTGNNGNTYNVDIPGDAGVAIPGYYFLFALDGAGVPSVAQQLKVTL